MEHDKVVIENSASPGTDCGRAGATVRAAGDNLAFGGAQGALEGTGSPVPASPPS